jgi:hypothetical protein
VFQKTAFFVVIAVKTSDLTQAYSNWNPTLIPADFRVKE